MNILIASKDNSYTFAINGNMSDRKTVIGSQLDEMKPFSHRFEFLKKSVKPCGSGIGKETSNLYSYRGKEILEVYSESMNGNQVQVDDKCFLYIEHACDYVDDLLGEY